ncbi:MAG TPA: N-acetylmuramoyl-L-alanine amidase [Desulfobacteraceae bacterium]|jgi:N-acetylmuramoyl-L-alanine amidase|nr:N-acetylmuramoyl-L-alanine amidase [Desulfobacteraceae bacterium]
MVNILKQIVISLVCLCCVFQASAHAAVIALDVGHFTARPGAISTTGETEFEFNRALAQILRQVLHERGFTVKMIGESGDMKELEARTRAAKGADIFLSLHHDSVQPRYLEYQEINGRRQHHSERFSGFSLFVSRINPDTAQSLACAVSIGKSLRQAGFTPSPHHAEPIPGENRVFADALNGVYYFDELVVLKTAAMPAVLIEAGIIVNRNDEILLRQPETRKKISTAIADGIEKFFKKR